MYIDSIQDNITFNTNSQPENEIIIYQPDETLKLDVKLAGDTVWLTQGQMVELFQTSKQNISLHINNIFKEGELIYGSVVKESLTAAADGKRYRTKFYSLDVIISVGYRVKSLRGTQFRQWANKVLKEYLLRGYSVNQRLAQMEDRIDRHLSEHDKRLDNLRKLFCRWISVKNLYGLAHSVGFFKSGVTGDFAGIGDAAGEYGSCESGAVEALNPSFQPGNGPLWSGLTGIGG